MTVNLPRENKLKRCPFCGGKAVLVEDKKRYYKYHVVCYQCGTRTIKEHISTIAIDRWNMRADINTYKCEVRITKNFKIAVTASDIHEAIAKAKRQTAEKLKAGEYISGYSIEPEG